MKTAINASAISVWLQIINALAKASAVVNFPILPELTGLAGTISGNLRGSKPITLSLAKVSAAKFHEQSTPTRPPTSPRIESSGDKTLFEKGSSTIPRGGKLLILL